LLQRVNIENQVTAKTKVACESARVTPVLGKGRENIVHRHFAVDR
jgi:hypothetical protein